MQSPIVQLCLLEVEANQGPPYGQTNDLLKHADFLHSNKQGNNVFSLNLPA